MPRFPKGTKLSYGDDILSGSPTYTEVLELGMIDLPIGFDIDEEDTTTHQSAATDNFKRYSALLADLELLDFEIMFDIQITSHAFLADREEARTLRAWKIELPLVDATNTVKDTYTFDGYVKSLGSPTADPQGVMRASGQLRVSENLTFDPEAAS